VLLVDTAGRLHVDSEMMDENGHIDKQTILEQIFVTAADADANYPNFIKRTLELIIVSNYTVNNLYICINLI
jgi:hypothetical protein